MFSYLFSYLRCLWCIYLEILLQITVHEDSDAATFMFEEKSQLIITYKLRVAVNVIIYVLQ